MSNARNASHRGSRATESRESTNPETRGERRLVSPFRCRIWTQHSRLEEQLTEYDCKSLRDSIAKNGQHQPALGRPVTDDPEYDVEIICGARRHAAALALGRDLLVEVRVISDAEAYVAMYEENAERKDDCAYVQGQILRRALRSETCSSQGDLARSFSLSHSKVSRLLMIAQLPSIVVAAFRSPRDIRESWGVELYQFWKDKDPEHAIAGRARALANKQPRPPPRQVFETLITAPSSNRAENRVNQIVSVRGSNGVLLFREQDHIGSVTFTVPKTVLSPKEREALRQAMIQILEAANAGATSNRPTTANPKSKMAVEGAVHGDLTSEGTAAQRLNCSRSA